MSKEEKINWLSSQLQEEAATQVIGMKNFWHHDAEVQRRFDEFSENTLTNFDMPFGLAPNFMINGKVFSVPMVIEESSVVAAASLGAKFWLTRGGFHCKVISTSKVGQVHFEYKGDKDFLKEFFANNRDELIEAVKFITSNMVKRGGGITGLKLVDMTDKLENYFQLRVEAETCDAMGANFINSILEEMARVLKIKLPDVEIIMCILSNYTPDCVVEAFVECDVEDLGVVGGLASTEFAQKFAKAVKIAQVDVSRAVTHNKGIMNGVDAVVLATGNDFRAIEACAHAYASRGGQYRSLSNVTLENNKFRFSIKLPLAVGTTGGLTSLHPLAKTSMTILKNPTAPELMQIMAAVGLAQNFGAVRSLVTTGIQKGHMKLHLLNILNQLDATPREIDNAKEYFSDKIVSFTAVRNFLTSSRTVQ